MDFIDIVIEDSKASISKKLKPNYGINVFWVGNVFFKKIRGCNIAIGVFSHTVLWDDIKKCFTLECELNGKNMIFWSEYKEFKKIAEQLIKGEAYTDSLYIQIQVTGYADGKIKRDDAIEEIINILSDFKHKQKL